MNRLPTEILEEIFNRLHLVQKLECMLVCRRWSAILRLSSLLYTTTISENRIFNQFVESIRTWPYQGAQVKRLILSGCLEKEFDSRKLFTLFPNIKVLYINHYLSSRCSNSKLFSNVRSESLASSRNQIEHIVDHANSEFTFHLLNSGVCPNLTTLVLDLMYTTKSCGHLGVLLVNTPSLLSLKILRSDITMDDFESIHACLPKLDSISLEMVNLIINDTPTVIYPATTVKTLSLFFHDVHVDSQIQWLWYIYKKYTQLSHLEFSNFNKHFWKPDTVADISMHGFLPLIQGLGRRLESFKTPSIPLDTSLFKHFDQSGCQIHTLNCFSIDEELLVRSLTQSYQGFHIQKLTLRDITPFPVELLRNLPSLKSLEMIYKYNRDDHYRLRCSEIDLNQVLKACPTTLESLHLEKALFDCDASSSDIYGIKSLTLVCPLLPRQMDKFLSNSLPKLRSLTLKGCIPCGATLNLPNHNLSYLEIVTRDWKASTFISKTTLNDAQNSFYAIKGTGISTDDLATTVDNIDFFGHIAAKPVAYKDLEHCTFTKIICGSVQTLIINNYLVC